MLYIYRLYDLMDRLRDAAYPHVDRWFWEAPVGSLRETVLGWLLERL